MFAEETRHSRHAVHANHIRQQVDLGVLCAKVNLDVWWVAWVLVGWMGGGWSSSGVRWVCRAGWGVVDGFG